MAFIERRHPENERLGHADYRIKHDMTGESGTLNYDALRM